MFASSSLFYIMQIIHIAENSTNNVLLAIAKFKYRIYCNVLSFTILTNRVQVVMLFFYMCCTCWYDKDIMMVWYTLSDDGDDEKDIFASPYYCIFRELFF